MYFSSITIHHVTVSSLKAQILPWGIPRGGGGEMGSCLLVSQHLVTKYSIGLHIPLWTAYIVDGNVSTTSVVFQISCTLFSIQLLVSSVKQSR